MQLDCTHKASLLIAALLLCAFTTRAQTSARVLRTGVGAPTGSCRIFSQGYGDIYINLLNGQFYTCKNAAGTATNNGTWNLISGGGGGGAGDVTGPSASTDGELVLFNGITGKAIRRSNSLTGYVKVASGVVTAAAISTSDLPTAVADGATKGVASFNAADFNATAGVIAIDYSNGQSADSSTKGFLTAADWTAFHNKGDMLLGTAQSVTAAKTFSDGTLVVSGADYGASDGSMPTGVEKALFLNTNSSSRRLFIFNNGSFRELFQSGVSQVNVASQITGVTPKANGGTGNSTWDYATLTDGATVTWTVAGLVNNAVVTLGGNRTLAFSGLVNGMSGTLIVKQDATGSRSLTLPAGSKVINGGSGAITLSTTANAIDILTWTYDGTNTYWTFGKNYN